MVPVDTWCRRWQGNYKSPDAPGGWCEECEAEAARVQASAGDHQDS